MKCLTYTILTSNKLKEKDEAVAIKKEMENFDFVFMLVVQSKILQIVNISSKAMQCKIIDLISAYKLLRIAAQDNSKTSFEALVKEAFSIASK